jgi:hypothetical protein
MLGFILGTVFNVVNSSKLYFMASENRDAMRHPQREDGKRSDVQSNERTGKIREAAFNRVRENDRNDIDRNTQRMNDLYERSSI